MKELESQFWSNLPSFLKLQQPPTHPEKMTAGVATSELDDVTTAASSCTADEEKYAKHSLFHELLSLVRYVAIFLSASHK